MPKPSLPDLTGQKFGRLTVVAAAPSTLLRHRMWRCVCSCGDPQPVVTTSGRLTSGYKKSCGCLPLQRKRERLAVLRARPGFSRNRSTALGLSQDFDDLNL